VKWNQKQEWDRPSGALAIRVRHRQKLELFDKPVVSCLLLVPTQLRSNCAAGELDCQLAATDR
jgi:hypothetical protein